jgi:isopenicillin N synthase-like dioxygenase
MQVLKVDYKASNAPELFTRSLKETGFGVLTNHPISVDLINQMYTAWEQFFVNATDAEKKAYLFEPVKQDGYIPFSMSETAKGYSMKDLKEFYHFYPSGRCPEKLRALSMQYYQVMSTLAQTLLSWIEQYTPPKISQHFSMHLSEMVKDSPNTLLRVLYYPPLKGDEPEGAIRAAAHEDINMITLLPAATATGLQVKDVEGNWHDVPCDYGSIAVNIGDMLQSCSEDYYPSTTHRVMNPTGAEARKARLSLPLFLHAKSEVKISKIRTAAEYLDERLKELGLRQA